MPGVERTLVPFRGKVKKFVDGCSDAIELKTPKAFAKLKPRVGAQRQPWDTINKIEPLTLKGFVARETLSGFHAFEFRVLPRVVAALQRWAPISQHLRC